MRTISMEQIVNISCELFNSYVEHVALSIMSGEVPSIMFNIHTRGTKEKDWLAYTRFKNTPAISVYKCDLYVDDVFRLCRINKLFLIDEYVYRIASLWYMLHPIYQLKYIYYMRGDTDNFDSMMASAGQETYMFMRKSYKFSSKVEELTLNVLNLQMMTYTNRLWCGVNNSAISYTTSQRQYEIFMLQKHELAYKTARFRKAQTCAVDEEGYIRLEKRFRRKS